jgi:hypothetical protein
LAYAKFIPRIKEGSRSMEGAFIFGPGGQMHQIIGQRGETPPCPAAKWQKGDVVAVRRLQWMGDLAGQRGAIATVVPPGFSPDWACAHEMEPYGEGEPGETYCRRCSGVFQPAGEAGHG